MSFSSFFSSSYLLLCRYCAYIHLYTYYIYCAMCWAISHALNIFSVHNVFLLFYCLKLKRFFFPSWDLFSFQTVYLTFYRKKSLSKWIREGCPQLSILSIMYITHDIYIYYVYIYRSVILYILQNRTFRLCLWLLLKYVFMVFEMCNFKHVLQPYKICICMCVKNDFALENTGKY